MDTDADFLAAIKATPDDDLPRQVYADWLEEHGEAARAEFIRVQIELAKLEAGLDRGYGGRGVKGRGVNAIEALRKRESEAFRAWKGTAVREGRDVFGILAEWVWPLRNWLRGFLDSVELPSGLWLAHGDAITAAHPVRTVRLTTWPDWERVVDPKTGRRFTDAELEAVPGWATHGDSRSSLSLRWPGVAFDLPAAVHVDQYPTMFTAEAGPYPAAVPWVGNRNLYRIGPNPVTADPFLINGDPVSVAGMFPPMPPEPSPEEHMRQWDEMMGRLWQGVLADHDDQTHGSGSAGLTTSSHVGHTSG